MTMVLSNFNADDYPHRTCCGILEHLQANDYPIPFYRPMRIPVDGEAKVEDWAVKVYKGAERRTMHPVVKDSFTLYMRYCPFCGKDFSEKEDDEK